MMASVAASSCLDDVESMVSVTSPLISGVDMVGDSARISTGQQEATRAERASTAKVDKEVAPAPRVPSYWTTWTEDGVGLYIALFIFVLIIIISSQGSDIMAEYSRSPEWPLGPIIMGFTIVFAAHYILGKAIVVESYCSIFLIAILGRSIGNYGTMAHGGLGASLWAILIGICVRSCGFVLNKGAFNGEFFVKIGVTLLAMDFSSIVSIGLPGLLVAWLDTVLILAVGSAICYYLFKFQIRDAIVIAGATSICGSSAATALSASLHPKGYKDEVAKTMIAIMGVLNAPLMPLMPLAFTVFKLNPTVIGAWIGGSIDSTGQVTASAQYAGKEVLRSAVVIKMAQNILIGPLCLFFTAIFHKTASFKILIDRFPLFVVGFIMTSISVSCILSSRSVNQDLKDTLVSNAWGVSEFITLMGFACIGLEIDIRVFFIESNAHRNVLFCYFMIQTLDLLTTFGWSYLAFGRRHVHDDDAVDDPAVYKYFFI
jgi:uncharacterized membrane protein YadS